MHVELFGDILLTLYLSVFRSRSLTLTLTSCLESKYNVGRVATYAELKLHYDEMKKNIKHLKRLELLFFVIFHFKKL